MQLSKSWSPISVCAVLLGLVSFAVSHGADENSSMETGGMAPTTILYSNATAPPSTYFRYGEHSGLLIAHIVLMTIAWVFILPICVMFSISRYRLTFPTQALFLSCNALGALLVTIYNANTPDLYPNNAHHKIGWMLTWTMIVHVAIGVISKYAGRKRNHGEREGFIPISTEAMAEHQRLESLRQEVAYRFSNDSGQGTEPNTESLRSQSISSSSSDHRLPDVRRLHEEGQEKHGLMHGNKVERFLSSKLPGPLSHRALRILEIGYDAVDRLALLLGFTALTSGIVTYGGFFMDREIFSGLAHFIKGSVFFWYGILTLGRWAGCFQEIGWAWNINPSKSTRPTRPTAEFVESFLIFFYGSTNVFLEHLNAWGKAWSVQDLEHLSITILFFSGGLCGMLVESRRIRDLLNNTRSQFGTMYLEKPKSYDFSMNPLPTLVVLLLGTTMSSHHQASMVSTMIHKQWGSLLCGAAFSRGATYVIFYLKPPKSVFPGRPPTELVTGFCLMAGGIVFMASAKDLVAAMEANGLDGMFIFTVAMGMVTFLMAWTILVIAMKGWAVRKEDEAAFADRGLA